MDGNLNFWKSCRSPLELCGRGGVDPVSEAVVGVVHVEQVDLLQDVVRVVQRSRRGRQTGELLDQPTVLSQQSPHLVLRVRELSQAVISKLNSSPELTK